MAKVSFNRRNGGFDEVVADNASIHLERMSPKHIWMVINTPEGSLNLDLKTVRFGMAIKAEIINDGFKKVGQHSAYVKYHDADADPFQPLWDAIDPPAPIERVEKEFYIKVMFGLSFFTFASTASLIWALMFGYKHFGLLYSATPPALFILSTAALAFYTYMVTKRDVNTV